MDSLDKDADNTCKIVTSNIIVGLISLGLAAFTLVEMFEMNDLEFRGDTIDIIILAILSCYNFYEAYCYLKKNKEDLLKKLDKIKSFMLVVFTLALTSVFLMRYFDYKKC